MNRRTIPSQLVQSSSSGFALVVVIWISGFLAVFAISVTVSMRSHTLFARNATSEVLAKGIADGLVQLTALQVADAEGSSRQDGTWRPCDWFDTARAWVAIQDQSGLVDLNTASPRLMTALLEGIGLTQVQAMDMVAAMRDYRDADDASDFGQSEADTYSGRNFGPKNAAFEAVEELDQLPGMTPALFGELRELTTVSTQQTGFDFATAPERLLQVLQISRTSVAGLSFSSPRSSRVSAITVAVQVNDGTRFVRRAMIERTDQPQRPFVVLSWDGAAWPLLSKQEAASNSCIEQGG
jgi:type II secretory pathway component PulK